MKSLVIIWLLMPINAWAISPFQKYGDEFMALANRYGIPTEQVDKLKIRFGHPKATELSSSNIGYCNPEFVDGFRIIDIDERQWNNLPVSCRRALVWHEMAHCGLKKAHTKEGLMRPQLDCSKTSDEDFFRMIHGPELPNF